MSKGQNRKLHSTELNRFDENISGIMVFDFRKYSSVMVKYVPGKFGNMLLPPETWKRPLGAFQIIFITQD